MNVQKQHNTYDCGPYALDFAIFLLHGQDATQLSFSDPRTHLLMSNKNGPITPCPAKTEYRQPPVTVGVTKYVHCTCRLDAGSRMMGCNSIDCDEWVHNSCTFLNGEHSGDWLCDRCQTIC